MKNRKSSKREKPKSQEDKEILERRKIENELKWSSGWRRIVDKFITPTSLGVIGLLVGTMITYNNWISQKRSESTVQLQRNLVIPGLAGSAAEKLASQREEGFRALWHFLSSSDSSTVDARMAVFDALADYSESNAELNIWGELLAPLLPDQIRKRKRYPNSQSLTYLYHMNERLWKSIEHAKIQDNVHESMVQFYELDKKWHSLVSSNSSSRLSLLGWICVPEGNFINRDGEVDYLAKYFVRIKAISPNDSTKLHKWLDGLDLIKDSTKTRSRLSNIHGKSFAFSRELGIGMFYPSTNPYIYEDSTVVRFNINPNLEFIYENDSRNISESEREMMNFKFERGISGTHMSQFYPYSPESMHTMQYVRYKNKMSRLVLPTNRNNR
ncbi:MAG: hypothetical protein H6695_07775 [Deferribacteres bacterium]|nr:hypothetical protein [Deferribacteres bacterium]